MQPALALGSCVVKDAAAGSEDRIVARLRAGELAALGDAYDAHHEHVRAFARRLIGEDAAAEDLVQETFLALPRAVRRFRGDSTLRTYLMSIAIQHARHFVRAAARRRAVEERLSREPRVPSATPADDVSRARLAARLLRALDTLPLEQRAAVVLCEVEERTSVEAARILGIPEGTVRTRLFHAKRKLADVLAKEGLT
jgi:RNA polymerase sigma-70 factor (ECF subfamily)